MRVTVVPACPSCSSVKTGYYLPDDLYFQEIKLKKFQKGERVRPFPLMASHYPNCYCADCNFIYHAMLQKVKMDNEMFHKHLLEKKFVNDYRFYASREKERDEIRKEIQKQKSGKRKAALSIAILVITGIDIRKLIFTKRKSEEEM